MNTISRRPSAFFPSASSARESLRKEGYRFHYFDHDSGEDIYVRVRLGNDNLVADVASLDGGDGHDDSWRICYY